jgi:nicotinate phosphoribosyltransferase
MTNPNLPGWHERLDPTIFDLPLEKMRQGYYADKYFVRAKQILERDNYHPHVLMQIFQKNHSVVGGIDEAIAILKLCSGYYDQKDHFVNCWDKLEVKALYDGDEINPYETIMTIEGDYSLFAHLETDYLGVLARRTRVATNTKRVVEAANGKGVMFFPARFDHHLVQTGDGYAAYKSGALGVSTDAQAAWWGEEGLGTVPHALIAAYGGNTVLATQKFAEFIDPKISVISLVDFENDCVKTSLEVARALGKRLYGVRLDTSNTLVDKSIQPIMGQFPPTGVIPELVWNVRQALDAENFQDVKIVVSGGFNVEKIKRFEALNVPVDMYAVGSSLFEGNFDYTADVVINEGKPSGKIGRLYHPNSRLEKVV